MVLGVCRSAVRCQTPPVPRKPISSKVTLQARADGEFRFAVVADTHSKPHPATAQRIRELEPDVILHAGDIGELEVLGRLGRAAPVIAVRGNIDVQTSQVPDIVTLELHDGERMKLRLLLLHIAVYGPKLRAEVARLASARTCVTGGLRAFPRAIHRPRPRRDPVQSGFDRPAPFSIADPARHDRHFTRERAADAHRL